MTQISLSGVAVEFGATPVLRDVSFTVGAGDKWGILGRNGGGKTTIFRLITGELRPTRGSVSRTPRLRVALLEQHRDLGDASSVWEAVAGGFGELRTLERRIGELAEALGSAGADASESLMDEYGHALERFEREGGYSIEARVDAALEGMGFDAQEARTRPLTALSGGERGRVALARQLVTPSDVLLLDEPTNHLDLETTRWLERWLRQTDRTVLLISHDRAFLAAVADHMLHVEAGTAVAYTGGYESFVIQRTERRLSQQRSYEKQSRSIAKEEEYIRRNIAGVNSRQAKGRRTRLARLPRLSPPPSEQDVMALRLESPDRGGDQVLVAQRLHVSIGGRPLLRNLTATIHRGERVVLVGPNGTGKSTLLRTVLGQHPPESGLVRLGSGITAAWYRQDLAQVPMGKAIYDVIQELRPLWNRGHIQAHLARFGFSGDEVQRMADALSGGERARVALAMMVLARANFLVFDEPTNHLDIESIEALEDALDAYEGTVLLVSHDRELLRGIGDRVWALEGGEIEDFQGSFAEWEAVREERDRTARDLREAAVAARKAAKRKAGAGTGTARESTASRLRRSSRDALREVERAEGEVAVCEERVSRLEGMLEDPGLYSTAEGTRRSHELAGELASARAALERAITAWERAEEQATALADESA